MTGHWVVIGGAGFIGSHLVRLLCAQGLRVTVLDDFSTGRRCNLANPQTAGRMSVIEGDAASPDALGQAMPGAAGVFHCAAKSSVVECVTDWIGSHRSNATTTLQVFDAALRHGNLPVVYASSAAVYGDRSEQSCHEQLPERPISPYGADKLACEHHARAFWHIHGLPSAGLRLFNVYGAGQPSWSPYSGVLARFLRDLEEGRPHVIHGTGQQTRDFVAVQDVARAMVAAMSRIHQSPEAFVTNVCTGRARSLLQVVAMLDALRVTNGMRHQFEPPRPGDIRHSRGDPTRMKQLLGLGDMIPLEQGLAAQLGSLAHTRNAL